MLDMFALMLNIHSKQSENDDKRSEIKQTSSRLAAVKAKVGGEHEVAERLSLAIRQLSLPPPGLTDLDMVKQVLEEIRAPGIDVTRDIIKAVRKLPAKPVYNPTKFVLGFVLVEIRVEDSSASIMKSKHVLHYHADTAIKNLIIKNMKSREHMLLENLGNGILKKILGYENFFVAPNGQIRESTAISHNPSRPPYNPSTSL